MKKYGLIIIALLFISVTGFIPQTAADGENWLWGWDYRRTVDINGSAGAGTNYQVYLTVEETSEIEFNFADIRFTDNDGNTLLDYWMEGYLEVDPGGSGDDNIGYFWVNVTDNLDTDQTIYMYYGNDAVSTTSNGTDTFLFYEDWSSQTVAAVRWDVVVASGTESFSTTDANHGYVMKMEGDAGNVYHLETDLDVAGAPTALIFRAHLESTVASAQRTRIGTGQFAGSYGIVASNYGTDEFMVADDGPVADNQAMTGGYFDSYWRFEITRDGTNAKLYADHTLIETGSCDPDTNTVPIAMMYVRDSEYDLYSDWIAGRKFVAVEPVFDSFGNQETEPPRAWATVGEVELIFPVGWDPTFQFGYDAFFIFAGLIMIPLSTIYMVRGGRKGASMDKLFYALIIFMVGLGLLVGGIMP